MKWPVLLFHEDYFSGGTKLFLRKSHLIFSKPSNCWGPLGVSVQVIESENEEGDDCGSGVGVGRWL